MEAKGPASVRASMRRKEAITMNRTKQAPECSINNIYQLDGRVPLGKAIPFGLQHILAMFVSNLAPITLIAASAQPALSQAEVAILLQNAMFVAGIATLIQLYPIWKVGSKLPVVISTSPPAAAAAHRYVAAAMRSPITRYSTGWRGSPPWTVMVEVPAPSICAPAA